MPLSARAAVRIDPEMINCRRESVLRCETGIDKISLVPRPDAYLLEGFVMRPHAEDPHDSLVCNTAFFELSLDDLINEAMLTIDAPRMHALQAANQLLDEALVILNDHFRWMIERQCDMLAKSRLIGV